MFYSLNFRPFKTYKDFVSWRERWGRRNVNFSTGINKSVKNNGSENVLDKHTAFTAFEVCVSKVHLHLRVIRRCRTEPPQALPDYPLWFHIYFPCFPHVCPGMAHSWQIKAVIIFPAKSLLLARYSERCTTASDRWRENNLISYRRSPIIALRCWPKLQRQLNLNLSTNQPARTLLRLTAKPYYVLNR